MKQEPISNLLLKTSKQKSLVALRRIENHTNFSKLSLKNIKISNELIKSVKDTHRCYQDELEKQRKIKQESHKSLKPDCCQ